jgi:hypothetical protein
MSTIAAAALAIITAFAPPERASTERSFPGWKESSAERRERYASIAADVEAVVSEPGAPAVLGNRLEAATLLTAVAFHESGFARDVDLGPCYRGADGRGARCDSGRAVCLVQIQARAARDRDELQRDRRACLRRGLRAIATSLATCKSNSPQHRLAGLSGSCSRGLKGSREIWALYQRATVLRARAESAGS